MNTDLRNELKDKIVYGYENKQTNKQTNIKVNNANYHKNRRKTSISTANAIPNPSSKFS
jgi:hypothetical protein